MVTIAKLTACLLLTSLALVGPAASQSLDVQRYNPAEWTKGRFSEVVTVTGPGKTIYLAGVGAEDETSPAGALPAVRHLGNVYEQCKYSYDKIKRLLAAHGGTLGDTVKQVTYVTDIRFLAAVGRCRGEAFGGLPIPTNTFIAVSALAVEGMLVEIDVTAVVPR